jgi:hypothetical protein
MLPTQIDFAMMRNTSFAQDSRRKLRRLPIVWREPINWTAWEHFVPELAKALGHWERQNLEAVTTYKSLRKYWLNQDFGTRDRNGNLPQ